MTFRVALVSSDRHLFFDGRMLAMTGLDSRMPDGVSLLTALAALGHDVTAHINCSEPFEHAGVRYAPFDRLERIDADVLIGMSTGTAPSFAPLRGTPVQASLRVVWAQGVLQPSDLDAVSPDYVCAASNFLRDVAVERWGFPRERLFVCYSGLQQGPFEDAAVAGIARDPFAVAYLGRAGSGVDASMAVLERLRRRDARYHLDVLDDGVSAGALFECEYGLAPQAIEDGFGPAVQEAKRAGQIVLASDVGAFHELIRSSWDGFLIPHPYDSEASHDAMAHRILELAHDPARRERLRRRALGTPWDWRLAARTWTAWWDEVLGRERAPHLPGPDGEPLLALPDGRHSAKTGLYFPDVYPASPMLDRLGQTNRVLVGGYYGHGNLGDEAILHVLLEELREAIPNVSAVVASGNPDETRRVHDVGAVGERDIPALLDAAAASDLVLLGGGGLFQDYQGVDPATFLTSLHWGLTYFDAFPAVAILARKPFMLYAVGVGPLGTADGLRYTRLALERVDAATVRDPGSLELLTRIGASTGDVGVAADPAFLVNPAPGDRVGTLLAELGLAVRPGCLVAVALREWDLGADADWAAVVAEALDRFVERHDASLLFVPFQADDVDAGTDDRAAAERVVSRIRNGTRATICRLPLDAAEVSGLLGACDLVLAMRLHATIFAAVAGVPTVALAYDPKVAAAMDRVGLPDFSIALPDATADRLFERLDACYQGRDLLRARIAARVPPLRVDAAASTAPAVALLRHRPFEPRPASSEWDDILGGTLAWHIRRVATVEADRAALATQAEDSNTRAEQLASEVETAHARVARLEAEREGRRARVQQLTSDLRTATERVAQLETEGAIRLARVRQLTSEVETAALRVAALEAKAETLSSEYIQARGPLAAANRERLGQLARLAEAPGTTTGRWPAVGDARARSAPMRALEQELRTIHASRAWRAITAYRRVRRAIASAVSDPGPRLKRLGRAALNPPGRDRIRRVVAGRWLNPYAFVFDLYRRARASTYGRHVGGVRAPGERDLVSIVLPVYNGDTMISDAIESVLGQTHPHFELIVVDDGSTDDTPLIVDEYARRDRRIRVIHQENQKLPRALSRAFREARGEFLTWTSCDNRLKPACLESLVGNLRRHPCWDMTYANLDLIGEDGQYLRGSHHYEAYQRPHGSEHVHLPESTADLNTWPNNFIGAAFMYRSRVAVLVGDYSTARFVSEDYDYWMRVNALLNLRHADVNVPVYDYRFHTRSLTSRWAELRMLENRERLMVFEDFRRDFYLSPLVWIVEGAGAAAAALEDSVRQLGHLLYDGAYALEELPRLFVPLVSVHVGPVNGALAPPRPDLPQHALKIFVTTDTTLSDTADDGWDLCCVLGTPQTLPRLRRPYQGWLAAADAAALAHAIDIRAKSDHLARIEAETEAPRPGTCAASVIVCTHRSGPRLAATVRSVVGQRFDGPYELLLVNNAPSSAALAHDVAVLRAEWPADHPAPFRVVMCPIAGLSAARNAGLAEAEGEVVCFLDDDAVADEGWLARLLEAFEAHPEAGVIGGHIHLKIPEPRPRALRPGWEKYWSHFVTGFEEYTEVRHWWEFPWGANWAARRSALLLAGGFRSRYGRVGDNAWGGEELVAAAVVQRLGYAIAVLPQAAVVHDVDPARFTFLHVLKTLVAGHQVGYLAQRDLYVPFESGMRATLWQLFTQHVDPGLPGGQRKWRNVGYRKFAQLRLLAAQARDGARRLRTAVVATDPCGRANRE